MEFLKRAECNAWVQFINSSFLTGNWYIFLYLLYLLGNMEMGKCPGPLGGASSDSHFSPLFGSGSIRLKRCQAKGKAHYYRLSVLKTKDIPIPTLFVDDVGLYL